VPDLYTGALAGATAVDMHIADYGGWKRRYFPADVRKLNVLRVEADDAYVELDAFIHRTSEHPALGQKHSSFRLTGPVVLRRQDGAWRVETFKSSGNDLVSGFFRPVPAEMNAHNVRVAAYAQLWHKHRQLIMLVQNDGQSDVVVERVVARSAIWWLFDDGGLVRRNPLIVPPGASWGFLLALKPRWRPAPLRVNSLVDGREVELLLEEPAHVSLVQRLRSNGATVLFFVAVLAGIVVWAMAPDIGPRLLAIALLFGGAVQLLFVGVSTVRGIFLSATAFYLATGLAEVTGGAVLLSLHQLNLWPLVLGFVTLVLAFARQFQQALHERRADASDAT
jgi:hypothetical protein